MLFARLAGTLGVLVLLSACSEGRGDPSEGPRLPAIELSSTTVGAAYEALLTATGGTPPLRYGYVGSPPPGFSYYSADSKLTGPATEAGEFAITLNVRDAEGDEDVRTYTLKVWPAPVVSGASVPVATAGAHYEHTFLATGGRPPLRWSVVDGSLPTGLSLSAEAVLSGLPQGRGTYPFTLRVVDANGARAEAQVRLELRAPGDSTDGGPADGGPHDGGPLPDAFPLAVVNWNIEWFGDTSFGPEDEPLQLANVQSVITSTDADIWGLAEIVSTAQFNALKAGLPGYDGFLADDGTRVSSGTGYYHANEQKVGVLFKSNVVRVLSADVVLGQYDYDFGSRPPLRVDLRVTRGGGSVDVTLLILHMKATSSTHTEDYARRLAASGWLKQYLEGTPSLPARVMVLGDWNDDVDQSTTTDPNTGQRRDTPYRNFVNDTARYLFTTQALSLANVGSSVGNSSFIDHQLVTNELAASLVANSTTVVRPAITRYSSTTSDHYPILSRFDFGTAAGRSLRVTAPNGGETLDAGNTFTLTWTASGMESVRVQYTVDGLAWRDIAASVSAATGRYTWTVPSEASTNARVRVLDAADATFSDMSDGAFTLRRPTPQVFINEYLPFPNNLPNSSTPDYDQTFVEVINTGTTSVDLGGWKLHDAKSFSGDEPTRHTFPAGTTLAPGKVYVVYSGPTAYTGAANTAYANGGDGLRFNRGINVGSSGDSVYLVLPDGTVQDSDSYDDTYPGVSYNRSPDASATGTWVLHNTLSSTLTASPGRRANGTAF